MSIRLASWSAPLAALALLAAPAAARADDCKSHWREAGDAFRKLSPYVVQGGCLLLNRGDDDASKAAAQQCIDDFEKAKKKIDEVVRVYNTAAGSGTIGPRGLGWDRWYSGNLKAERTFIGEQLMSDSADFVFEATGGKGQAEYDVTVCWLDAAGEQARQPVSKTFRDNDGTWKKTFTSVLGLRPIVYLENSKVSTKGHEYQLKLSPGAEPAWLATARRVAKGTTRPKAP